MSERLRGLDDDLSWPSLPLSAWRATFDTLHRFTQIVGKVRLGLCAPVNHLWHAALEVTVRGLSTGPMPYGTGALEIEFDLLVHELRIRTSAGAVRKIGLFARPVADFYHQLFATLLDLGIEVHIRPIPDEVEDRLPFPEDHKHASYDPKYVQRYFRALMTAKLILDEFRGRFLGKASPVQFFWGSFDLAASRFSGRRAPPREDADAITRVAYSHEVCSAGFWPGGGPIEAPAFYAYLAPAPDGLATAHIEPDDAFYSGKLSEFLLLYDDARSAASPTGAVLDFLQSTYEAGATLAGWDREALELGHEDEREGEEGAVRAEGEGAELH